MGQKFVESYGYTSPPLPFDHGEVYDDLTDELLTRPSGLTLQPGEATPDSLVRAGVCTLLDWCDFLNGQRFDALHAGPLALPDLELTQWAKRESKGMTKTNLIKTHYKRPKAQANPVKTAAWTLGVKRGKSAGVLPRDRPRNTRARKALKGFRSIK